VRIFRQKFTLEDAIGSHACSLETNTRVTNGIPLGCSLFLPVHTVNCVQTLKARKDLGAPMLELLLTVRACTRVSSAPSPPCANTTTKWWHALPRRAHNVTIQPHVPLFTPPPAPAPPPPLSLSLTRHIDRPEICCTFQGESSSRPACSSRSSTRCE
jgi:hypothetical protein